MFIINLVKRSRYLRTGRSKLALLAVLCLLLSLFVTAWILTDDAACRMYNLFVHTKRLVTNCRQAIQGDSHEKTWCNRMSTRNDDVLNKEAKNCGTFMKFSNYVYERGPGSNEEKEYQIAYSILIYHHVAQFERLLRAIYAPQNIYCVHVDLKANEVYKTILNIQRCLPNVFATRRENIAYAGYSRLQADLNCFGDLLKRNRTWRYVINLSGEMFPLRTNRELVKILKLYNGSNDISGYMGHAIDDSRHRWEMVWKAKTNIFYQTKMTKNGSKHIPPPGNITMLKGSAYGVFSREFIQYVMTDPLVDKFRIWTILTYSPDEHFWATLHYRKHNPIFKSPGGYLGDVSTNKGAVADIAWDNDPRCIDRKLLRGICIPNVKSLTELVKRKELFVNKLLPYNYDYTVLQCLEEEISNRTLNATLFDTTFYSELPFVNVKVR